MAVGPLLQQEKDPDRPFADKERVSNTQMHVKSVFHFVSALQLSVECLASRSGTHGNIGVFAGCVNPAQPLKFIGAWRFLVCRSQQAPRCFSTVIGKSTMRNKGVPH
jgi:hypothetical protein